VGDIASQLLGIGVSKVLRGSDGAVEMPLLADISLIVATLIWLLCMMSSIGVVYQSMAFDRVDARITIINFWNGDLRLRMRAK
jgi:hypothetical protein